VPSHCALQHAVVPASFEQLCPSEMQGVAAQNPFAPQFKEQQSVGAAHGVPCVKHLLTTEPQVWVLISQAPEQQVAPLVHESLKTPHDTAPSEPAASLDTEASTSDPPVPALPPVPPPAAPPEDPPLPPADASALEPSAVDASKDAAPPAPSAPAFPPVPPGPVFPPVPLPLAPADPVPIAPP
jgi:hypothetical protein